MKKQNKVLIQALVITLFNSSFSLIAQTTEFRKIENNAFQVGEKLSFDVKYGFITAGAAEMEIPSMKKMSGRDVYHITFKVASLSAFDALYQVRDRYETYLDAEGLFPWRFEQHIREGGYKRDFSAFFDQKNHVAKTRKGSYEIPPNVNDILSAFYFARTIDYTQMKIGDRVRLENFYKDKVYPLDVVYLGNETITVSAGTFDCIMVEPLVVEGGLFKNEGNIIVWLSNDELKIPVKVKTKVLIGSIDAELTKYEGLKSKLLAKK